MSAHGRAAGNLPPQDKRLIGRGEEVAHLRALCERSPLVTLTGVAGVGKTRLALQVAADLAPRFADGAWLVELSPLNDAASLPYAIADALPLVDQTTRPMIDVVADYLADRELLLVLDTCEHLVDACALAASALVKAAPGLRILATSRRKLGLVAEQVVTVDPLPIREPRTSPHPADAPAEDAVALLVERAAEAVPGFQVNEQNRADVVRLCRRLDGLPLAIELAAARLAEMPVAALTERLSDRFAVLGDIESGMSEADPPWHQALRTAIGWSHQLCAPEARLLWARASVFAGSFDAAAAQQVCADERLPAEEIPALLSRLVDKSILTWAPTGSGERFRMLDTIREYGAFWLSNLGETDRLKQRHHDHYLALAREGDAAWLGPDQFAWYDRMTPEHDNLRAALEFSLTGPEPHRAVELAGALWFYWYGCGVLKEGQHYLERALAKAPEVSPARAKALWACAMVMVNQGDPAAVEALSAECAAAADQLADTATADMAKAGAAAAAILRGDQARATALTEELLNGRREDELTLATLLGWDIRGLTHIFAGRHDEAVVLLQEMRTACDRRGERWHRAYGDAIRAQAELGRGRQETAQFYGRAALEVKHRLNDGTGMAMAIDILALAAASMAEAAQAARLLGLAQQLWSTIGPSQAGLGEWVAARQDCEKQTRAALGPDAYETAYRAGYETDLDTGIAHALGDAETSTPGAVAT